MDEALLLEAGNGRQGEVLRFRDWSRLAVVLGVGSKLAKKVLRLLRSSVKTAILAPIALQVA